MTDKEKAKELASVLVGEDQNQEPLIEILMEMAQWKQKHVINKACDAYCQICGHYAHSVPTYICRQNCQYYTDFRKAMEEEK